MLRATLHGSTLALLFSTLVPLDAAAVVLAEGDILATDAGSFGALHVFDEAAGDFAQLAWHDLRHADVDSIGRVVYSVGLLGGSRIFRWNPETGIREYLVEVSEVISSLVLESDSAVLLAANPGILRASLDNGAVSTVSSGGIVGVPNDLALDMTDGTIISASSSGLFRVPPMGGLPTPLLGSVVNQVAVDQLGVCAAEVEISRSC